MRVGEFAAHSKCNIQNSHKHRGGIGSDFFSFL
jgi:hypothetical protein